MKRILFIILLLVLNSCSDIQDGLYSIKKEKKENDVCADVICESYQECSEGNCIISAGRCNADAHCSSSENCNKSTKYCVNPCSGRSCSSHGTCVVNNHVASCNCNSGYSPSGLTCVQDDACANITCDEWEQCSNGYCNLKSGRCVSNNDCSSSESCNTSTKYCLNAMDIYEVTAGEFKQCVIAGNCTSANYYTNSQFSDCNLNKIGNENHPMNCVNWFGAEQYCTWKEKMLPTEEEWENAARGGESYIYSGSDNAGLVAWYSVNSGGTTHTVGTKQANGYGFYDMSGNVWEWTNSWYDSSQNSHVLRGGGFGYNAYDVRVDSRSGNPSSFYEDSGFRCMQSH